MSSDRGYAGASVALALVESDPALLKLARRSLVDLVNRAGGVVKAAATLGVSTQALSTLAARFDVTLPGTRR